MSRPRTRTCANEKCNNVFKYKRSNARYCPECRRKRSYRDRSVPAVVEEEPVVHRHPRPGRKRRVDDDGWIRIPIDKDRWQRVFDRVDWTTTLSDPDWLEMAWEQIRREAVEEFLWALYPIFRAPEFQEIDRPVAVETPR